MDSANTDGCKRVGAVFSIENIAGQYKNTPFQEAIDKLIMSNAQIRNVKRDGNCMYFCLIFLLLEGSLQNKAQPEHFLSVLLGVNKMLEEVGVETYLIEEFSDPIITVLKSSIGGEPVVLENLDDIFWDYTFMYFRMITSSYIKKHKNKFAGIIGPNVAEYCYSQIEVSNEEADDIEMEAIAQALGISFRVISLQGGQMTVYTKGTGSLSIGGLLHMPGHFDIIYCDAHANSRTPELPRTPETSTS